MKLVLSLCLVLAAAACKTNDAKPAESGSADPTTQGDLPKGRSAKINAPPPRLNGEHEPQLDGADAERDGRRQAREERRDERRKERIAALDKDGDGKLSEEEMAAGRKLRAEDMRKRFDANGDGKLTVEELGTGRMGRNLDVTTLDGNKDGDISADELATGMQQMREKMRQLRQDRPDGSGGRGPRDFSPPDDDN